ncbi:uncharacterized protein LOC144425871 [Styela clava]
MSSSRTSITSSMKSDQAKAERNLRLAQLKLERAKKEAALESERVELERKRVQLELQRSILDAETEAEQAKIELESVAARSSKGSTRDDEEEDVESFTTLSPKRLMEYVKTPGGKGLFSVPSHDAQILNKHDDKSEILDFNEDCNRSIFKIVNTDQDKHSTAEEIVQRPICMLDPGIPIHYSSQEHEVPVTQKILVSPILPDNCEQPLDPQISAEQLLLPNYVKPEIKPDFKSAKHDIVYDDVRGGMRAPDVAKPFATEMPNMTLNAVAQLTRAMMAGMTDVANIIKQGFTLPQIKLSVFDGNVLKYPEFVREFNNYIGSCKLDTATKLNYLISHCTGEAKEAIKSCGNLPSEEGYNLARNILHRNYGQTHLIIDAHLNLLCEGPAIKVNDIEAWDKLLTQARSTFITFSQFGIRANLDDLTVLRKIVKRFPSQHLWKFANLANDRYNAGDLVNFDTLLSFMESVSNVNRSGFGKLARESQRKKKVDDLGGTRSNRKVSSFLISEENSSKDIPKRKSHELKCTMCDGSHRLWNCAKFKEKEVSFRHRFVRQKNICFNCLIPGHWTSRCQSKIHCRVEGCDLKHHTLLHFKHSKNGQTNSKVDLRNSTDDTQSEKHEVSSYSSSKEAGSEPAEKTGAHVSSSFCSSRETASHIRRKVVPVRCWGSDGRSCDTYAFLDDGSDVSLCTNDLMKRLGIKGIKDEIVLKTLGGVVKTDSARVSLNIRGLREVHSIHIKGVRVLDRLPSDLEINIPSNADSLRCNHIQDLNFPTLENAKVEILVGVDAPEAHVISGMRRGKKGQSYAARTALGWALFGPDDTYNQCDESHVDNVSWISLNNERLHEQMEKAFETEFSGCNAYDTAPLIEDKAALSIMANTICKVDGHYQVSIPWKRKDAELPNNIKIAESRLNNLKKRLLRDPELHDKYKKKMEEYISNGHASRIWDNKLEHTKKTWYLPHHCTGGKFRIVFDASARYQDTSLNDNILCGPSQTNSLIGVLSRFPQEKIAVVADIKSMYHQVLVTPEDREALRFLWWPDGDLKQPVAEYQMNVHLFGGNWSPSVACYALKRVAEDNANHEDEETLNAIRKSFYVDDLERSEPTVPLALKRIKEVRGLLENGGFRLSKFSSNSIEVMNSIPEVDRAVSSENLNLDKVSSQKVLGLSWNIPLDSFVFEVDIQQKPHTRRGLLSMLSQVFDPLGMLGPFLLPMKKLLQRLCAQDLGWDDDLPMDAIKLWENWIGQLSELAKVRVPRWLHGTRYESCKMQLHTFCDASESGLGAVSYVRVVCTSGAVQCEFVAGKSRVTPLKAVSIPRLELCAAVVAAKLSAMIQSELEYKFERIVYWTDSMSVLQYINNVSTRFKVFVANRIATIHELSEPSQWRHVGTKDNPADVASRGVMPSKLNKCNMWFQGPNFLCDSEENWPERPKILPQVSDNDPETKSTRQVCATTGKSKPALFKILERYSSWTKLCRSVAWLCRFKKCFLWKYGKKDKPKFHQIGLSVDELKMASTNVIRLVQDEAFSSEDVKLTKSSSLKSLTPCLIDGVICVGGRLQRSSLSRESKHQLILPYHHHVTDLIIDHYHHQEGHSGVLHILSVIREKFWIIKGHSAIRNRIRRCLKCKMMHSKSGTQIMAPLPEVRVTPGNSPFASTGVDLMGPVLIKSGRSEVKRWAAIFTCMATRALHIEVVNSLDASAFLEAFDRFTARRGLPLEVFSDNGTNFTASNKYLKEGVQRWNESVHQSLSQREIKWNFNPPAASHWGGCWERMIRSVRKVLTALVGERHLTEASFYTFLTQVERILNNRPITAVGDDPKDLKALTPGMLLTGRLDPSYPSDIFLKADGYRKSWKLVQWMADQFWNRWVKEYLQILQTRQKWQQQKRNFAVGDLVLVMDENSPRGSWPKALVEEVYPDEYGNVRRVRVRTAKSTYIRDIRKLCYLESP